MNHFEFLVGDWFVANRRRKRLLEDCDEWYEFEGTSSCWTMLDGIGNVDSFQFPSLGMSGMTVRLLDVAAKRWSLYWASNRDGILQPPVSGRFEDGVGRFYGDDTYEGQPIRVRYVWSDITAVSARWEQAFSLDCEASWEVNWIMKFSRRSPADAS